jgi:hypothetical protein
VSRAAATQPDGSNDLCDVSLNAGMVLTNVVTSGVTGSPAGLTATLTALNRLITVAMFAMWESIDLAAINQTSNSKTQSSP